MERPPAQPWSAHPGLRPFKTGCPAARQGLAAGCSHRTDFTESRPGRVQPALSGTGGTRQAGAMDYPGGSAMDTLSRRFTGTWLAAGAAVAGTHRRRQGIAVGLRTGAPEWPWRRGTGLAGPGQFYPLAAAPDCRRVRLHAGLPVPPGKCVRGGLACRPAPATGAWRSPRHAHSYSQVPRQLSV